MRQGEVWRVRMPYGAGRAQAGDRPALIVQRDSLAASLPTILAVPFTSNPKAARFPGTMLVNPDGTNGLSVPPVALAFQLRAFDQLEFLRRWGEVDAATLAAIVTLIHGLMV